MNSRSTRVLNETKSEAKEVWTSAEKYVGIQFGRFQLNDVGNKVKTPLSCTTLRKYAGIELVTT